jgi:integral membrane protein
MRLLRVVALVEGALFLLLLFVAVPLKHLAGEAGPVMIVGPLHGLAFLAYVWLLARTAVDRDWPRRRIVRLALVGLIPFGAFFALRVLPTD